MDGLSIAKLILINCKVQNLIMAFCTLSSNLVENKDSCRIMKKKQIVMLIKNTYIQKCYKVADILTLTRYL